MVWVMPTQWRSVGLASSSAVCQANDLRDLFTYHRDDGGKGTETGDLFAGLDVETHVPARKRERPDTEVDGAPIPWVHHAEGAASSGAATDPASETGQRRGRRRVEGDTGDDGGDEERDDDDTAILRSTFRSMSLGQATTWFLNMCAAAVCPNTG